VPIPKATLLKGQGFTGYGGASPGPAPATRSEPEAEPKSEPEPVEPPPQELNAETKKLFDEIRARHDGMAKQNHFEVLGMKQDAKAADIRQAFTNLARRFHPDTLGQPPEDVGRMARELTARLNEANKVLGNDETRREYLTMLADERIRGDARRAELVRDAETKAQMGVVMLRKRDFQKARELFGYCVEADPVTASYKAQLAFAMYADRSFDRDEAFEKGYPLLLEALKSAGEGDAKIHHYTGLLLKERDRLKEALHHFKQAALIEPKNVDHKREVRLLQGRLAKDQEEDKKNQTGGLGRFFKR
jgi:curved DNA-binding protein CbpA